MFLSDKLEHLAGGGLGRHGDLQHIGVARFSPIRLLLKAAVILTADIATAACSEGKQHGSQECKTDQLLFHPFKSFLLFCFFDSAFMAQAAEAA